MFHPVWSRHRDNAHRYVHMLQILDFLVGHSDSHDSQGKTCHWFIWRLSHRTVVTLDLGRLLAKGYFRMRYYFSEVKVSHLEYYFKYSVLKVHSKVKVNTFPMNIFHDWKLVNSIKIYLLSSLWKYMSIINIFYFYCSSNIKYNGSTDVFSEK